MSADAEAYVAACTHPQVKGATRALFLAIATHIPEGETTTPHMTLKALAGTAQHTWRTAQTSRNLLEGLGLVRTHDGGRGNKARYEVVHLDGTRPVTPLLLPLRADLREVTSPPPIKAPTPLFDDVEDAGTIKQRSTYDPTTDQTAKNVGNVFIRYRARLVNVGNFFIRFVSRTIKPRSTYDHTYDQTAISVGSLAKEERSTSDHTLAAAPGLTTARDVHTKKNKNVHTHAARRGEERPTDEAETTPTAVRPPPVHPWHAWCGPVCVPKHLHDAWLDKGHTAAWLVAFYARTCAALPLEAARRVVDEFKFWRQALDAELTPRAVRANPSPRDTARHEGTTGSWGCDHDDIPCTSRHQHIERTLTDSRAARERQSG